MPAPTAIQRALLAGQEEERRARSARWLRAHRPLKNRALQKLLAARPAPIMSISAVARAVRLGRSHLSQVLNGARPGRSTWPVLARFLTHEEYTVAWEFAGRAKPPSS